MDTQNELLIRIDERVKSLYELVTTSKATSEADSLKIWIEIDSIRAEVDHLKLKAAEESAPIKIRNGLLWLLSAALIGWLLSFF